MFKYVWHLCKRNSLRVGRDSSAQSFQILRARCLCIHTHTHTHTLPLSQSCISFLSKAVDALVFRPLFQRETRNHGSTNPALCSPDCGQVSWFRDSRKKERDGGRERETPRCMLPIFMLVFGAVALQSSQIRSYIVLAIFCTSRKHWAERKCRFKKKPAGSITFFPSGTWLSKETQTWPKWISTVSIYFLLTCSAMLCCRATSHMHIFACSCFQREGNVIDASTCVNYWCDIL